MKLVCFFFAFFAPLLSAQEEVTRAGELIARLTHAFPDYAPQVFADPRFGFDLRVILPRAQTFEELVAQEKRRRAQKGKPPHKTKPRGQGKTRAYAYATSAWSLAEGERFIRTNGAVLNAAEKQFGVPKESVVATLDIETQFGKGPLGAFRVVKTLFTIAVFKPNIVKPGWAEEELFAFFAIAHEYGWDALDTKGSRRGAFGISQFEPTSYLALAMRFDGARCVPRTPGGPAPDLFILPDAICSTMNYHREMGLRENHSTHYAAFFRYNHDRRYARTCVIVMNHWRKKPKVLRASIRAARK